ncbi:MAG: SH3 domain-containing protein [Lachnospiraceae bacterium]|nr:SH3 domain-containing protein [Lachnospiraceae bacterium]
MSTSNNDKKEFLMSKLEILGNWLVKHSRIVMPVVLAVCVIVTVVISVSANKRENNRQEDVTANSTLEDITGNVVPEVPLQENDNPDIAELINGYYTAQVNGDVDTVRELVEDIDDKVVMRIEETSKYIESYPTLDIYYKPGPKDNTYVVYVCSTVKFIDYDEPVPGMTVHYVCQREDGSYYINRSDEGDEDELNYIMEVNLQDDVIDLNNKVTASYNNMVAEDEDLKKLIRDVNEEIEKNIGEALAQAEAEAEADSREGTEAGSETGETDNSGTITVVTKVKATDVVNIRSSDSETADKLGKAALGDEFDLIEKIENGWSKVKYNDGEAYIKSEYLEDVETTEVAANETDGNGTDSQTSNNNDTANSNNSSTDSSSNNNSTTVTGTVTVKENVRIRSGASENSEKLATAYVGDKLDVIMKQADGWTKIKYNGGVAYVKSDYVE